MLGEAWLNSDRYVFIKFVRIYLFIY